MEFSVAHIKSDNQFIYRTFNAENVETKIIDLGELSDLEVQALIYEDSLYENDEVKEIISEQAKFFPIRSSAEVNLASEKFEKLDNDSMESIFKKMNSNWTLQNNITLLEELFTVITHLNKLWPNDRTTFFEELWFILKSNLGAKELKIIFNDIELAKKETEKNKLIKARIEGKKLPHPFTGGEFEDKVMGHYEKEFGPEFSIAEFNQDKGELVLTCMIKKSPVLIMAKVYEISRIQKAVLKSLFDGLSF